MSRIVYSRKMCSNMFRNLVLAQVDSNPTQRVSMSENLGIFCSRRPKARKLCNYLLPCFECDVLGNNLGIFSTVMEYILFLLEN